MPLKVLAHLAGKKLHQLEIFSDGRRLGEYERSQAEDIDRKIREIRAALSQLAEIEQKHGQFVVRWSNSRRDKVIYVEGVEVGTIPKMHWRKPSWE